LATYSIRDLEKLSGIKAHTIRIWEQRYNIIEPKRTATNIRYYTDEDLQYLLNIAFLNRNGMRISKIARLTKKEILERVENIAEGSEEQSNLLQRLTMTMMELNELDFERILNQEAEKEGFEALLNKLLLPFLEKLSLLWLTGAISIVHEQFVHNLIRQRLAHEVYLLGHESSLGDRPRVLLFEPLGEQQEILLLLYHYYLRSRGCTSCYLGSQIPLKELEVAVEQFEPSCIFTTSSSNNAQLSPQDFLGPLCKRYPEIQIFCSAQPIMHPLAAAPNLSLFEDFSEFIDFLSELS